MANYTDFEKSKGSVSQRCNFEKTHYQKFQPLCRWDSFTGKLSYFWCKLAVILNSTFVDVLFSLIFLITICE